MSRFQIHDENTAPPGSVEIVKSIQSRGAQIPNYLGVLAGSPAVLRAYMRARSELRRGLLTEETIERILLATSAYYGADANVVLHERTARSRGLGIDEVVLLRERFDSYDEAHSALLHYLKAVLDKRGQVPIHLHEEAREAGWSDEQILEAIALVSLEAFTALVNVAGDVPVDGSFEETRLVA